jgi:hypothetical protein
MSPVIRRGPRSGNLATMYSWICVESYLRPQPKSLAIDLSQLGHGVIRTQVPSHPETEESATSRADCISASQLLLHTGDDHQRLHSLHSKIDVRCLLSHGISFLSSNGISFSASAMRFMRAKGEGVADMRVRGSISVVDIMGV